MKLVEAYRLEKKISILERSTFRGAPSNAKVIWQWLVDNGPSTLDEIRAALPDKKYSGDPAITLFLNNSLITKNGTRYSANTDYEWDDVGKIEVPRMNLADIQAAIANGEVASDDDIPNDVAAGRKAKAPKVKQVKPNIWSFKPEEVKAAIDAGVDVNSRDDRDRTPLVVAALSKRENAPEIIKILTENGANPSEAISQAVARKRYDSALLIANTRGYNPTKRVFADLTQSNDAASAANIIEVLVPKIDLDKFKTDRTMSSYYNLVADLMQFALRRRSNRLFDLTYNKFKSISDHPDVSYAVRSKAAVEINNLYTCKLLIDRVHDGYWLENPLFDTNLANAMNKDDLRRLFNLVKSKFNSIHVTNVTAFRREVAVIGMALGENVDFAREEYSTERILRMSSREASSLFRNSILTRDVNALKAIDDSERKDFLSNEFVENICSLDNSAKRVINLAIKIINKSLKAANKSVDYIMSSWAASSIASSKNTIIVEWFFDEDEDLLLQSMYRNSNNLSEAARSVFIAHGGQLNAHGNGMTRKPAPKRRDRRAAIAELENILKEDNSVRDIRNWEDRWEETIPDLWEDEEVIETVHDPKFNDSVLATQLRREVTKEPSKYNF